MPRYIYHCAACDSTYQIFHLMDEEVTICEKCEAVDCMERLPTDSYIKTTKPTEKEIRKPGEATREYIEEVREMVKEQKKELNKKGGR